MRRPLVFLDPDEERDAVYVLKRVADPKKAGRYTLEARFRYREPGPDGRTFVVPADKTTFETDLASVPDPATWLVPKDGTHTPAALLHDALISEPGKPATYIGPDVTREEADLIFREAMRHLGVPLLRRWTMWAAVSMATLMTRGRGRMHWYWRVWIVLVVGVLMGTGLVSILDLVDIHRIRIPLSRWTISTALPWMGDRPVGQELLGGLAAALAAAVLTPIPWGRRWRVGVVAGLGVIPLAFPIVVASVTYFTYVGIEAVVFAILRRTRRHDPAPAPPPPMLKRLA